MDCLDKLDSACISLFKKLDEADRDLITFYGTRTEINAYVLTGYANERGISKAEVTTRFNWLCYRLALEAHLINGFAWIEPPQHHKEPTVPKKKGKTENG